MRLLCEAVPGGHRVYSQSLCLPARSAGVFEIAPSAISKAAEPQQCLWLRRSRPVPLWPIRILALTALLSFASCYSVGDLYALRDVKVKVFDNVTERRTQEFDLTYAVEREMTARGLRVNGSGAPYTLEGRILDMRTPTVVSGNLDVVVVGSVSLRVEIRLMSADGREIWKDERTDSVTFTSRRGQTFDSARFEAFDRMARWVVAHFEKEW